MSNREIRRLERKIAKIERRCRSLQSRLNETDFTNKNYRNLFSEIHSLVREKDRLTEALTEAQIVEIRRVMEEKKVKVGISLSRAKPGTRRYRRLEKQLEEIEEQLKTVTWAEACREYGPDWVKRKRFF